MEHLIKYKLLLFLLFFLQNCKDEDLSLPRVPFTGNDVRTNGYYYCYWKSNNSSVMDYTTVFFLYRNGIILSAGSFESINLNVVENELLGRYNLLVKNKIGWGVFWVAGNVIEYEQWTTSVGGGLPIFKNRYNIENDTTLINPYGRVYHFRQFSPKPDSTNTFIK